MRVLLLGGTRFVGRQLVDRLIRRGDEVTILHRGVTETRADGVRVVRGDRSHPDGLAGLDGTSFDAVIDLSSYASDWTQRAVDALSGRVDHFIFISSGVVYQERAELPWSESSPLEPQAHWGAYAVEKLASERLLIRAHQAGRVAVTLLRLPFVLGPGNYADREAFVLSRLEAGQSILLPAGGVHLQQFVHFDDVARAVVRCLDARGEAAGHTFNIGLPTGMTNRGFVELLANAAGLRADTTAIDSEHESDVLDLADLVFPFPAHHYLLDVRAAERQLAFTCRFDHQRIARDVARWWASHPDHTPRRYAREEMARAKLADRSSTRTDEVELRP